MAGWEAIHRLLESVYGPAGAPSVGCEVRRLMDRFVTGAAVTGSGDARAPLTEGDVLLITYADQVHEPGQAPLRTLAEFCEAHLRGLVSGVHILPFYPSSSDDGFAVKDYFTVDPALGNWADVARMGRSFVLMFDAVFNHLSAQGDWFQRFLRDEPEFRDFFLTVEGSPDLSQVVRPRALPLLTEFQTAAGPRRVWTTFSADQVDLNFRNPRVLLAVLEALLFYVANGARFIRLDAIAFLWKEIGTSCLHLPQTHTVIRLMRAILDEVAPHVLLITETNVPHAENLSYFGDGANEAQLVYNFALPPLVLHSFASGSAVTLTRWAQSLALLSDRVAFLNFLASHDGIGLNPVRDILGESEIDALVRRTLEHGGFISYKDLPDGSQLPYEMNINFLDALSDPAGTESAEVVACKFLTAHAILLSLQGLPIVYFHSLFGSRGDRAGAEASGIQRRINREKLDRARLEAELSEVGAVRTRVLGGCCEMLSVRRRHPAFAPGVPQRVLDLDPRVFAILRQNRDGTDAVVCLHNVSSASVEVHLEGALPGGRRWGPVWSEACSAFSEALAVLEPYGSLWLGGIAPSETCCREVLP